MIEYKICFVIDDEESPSVIFNQETMPCIGGIVQIQGKFFVIEEVVEVSRSSHGRVYLIAKVTEAAPSP